MALKASPVRFISLLCVFLPILAGLSPTVGANETGPTLDIGGLLFGDLYYIPSHHLDEGDDAVGVVARRAYLTFDTDLNENAFGRLRFEFNQSGEFKTYTFTSTVKDLYLGWKIGRHQLLAGLSPTPTFDLVESTWGARYLARTPMDIQGFASRDTGIALRGPLTASGNISYRSMLGSGIEFGADSANSAKWMAAVTFKPATGWMLDVYADFEDLRGPDHRLTLQAFAAYQTDSILWGLQYTNQSREGDDAVELASVFAVKTVNERIDLIGRVDHLFEPSIRGDDIAYLPIDPSAQATMLIAGVKFKLDPHWSITPNTVVTYYGHDDQGNRPETDVYLRITLFANYE